jgi:putative transposase
MKNDKIWQERFRVHMIRDEIDHTRCIEYIHFNPAKHGYVDNPEKWKYSSFNRYVEMGVYEKSWIDGSTIIISGAEYGN